MDSSQAAMFHSGDALFAFDSDLEIVAWNEAAEELTGVSAGEAVGRRCWEVLGGRDAAGNLVCHRGCSNARLVREGWPLTCQGLVIKAHEGRRRVDLSTVQVRDGDRPVFLHVMLPSGGRKGVENVRPALTPRQRQILALLAEGVPAKLIAGRLAIAEPTVRNHIRALLLQLGSHSQLEAVAQARRLELIP